MSGQLAQWTETLGTELLGLHRIGLLGREEALSHITQEIRNVRKFHQTRAVLLLGKGGIGKTHLLHHLESLAQDAQKGKKSRQWAVSTILDLDNPEYATPQGLSQGLALVVAQMERMEDIHHARLREQAQKVEAGLRSAAPEEMSSIWEKWEQSLRSFLIRQAEDAGVLVIRIDTAEWLRTSLYDPETEYARQGTIPPWDWPIAYWFVEQVLKHRDIQNAPILWVLAGRPANEKGKDPLTTALRQAFPNFPSRMTSRTLKALSPRYAAEYLNQMAALIEPVDHYGAENILRYLKETGIMQILKHLPQQEEMLAKSHLYQITQGHPLSLAIFTDALRLGLVKPPFIPPAEQPTGGKGLSSYIRDILYRSFIQNPVLGKALLNMARARLGVSENIIQRWLGERARGNAKAYLDVLRHLSIVKIVPGKRRAFRLHDEMYQEINRYWPPTRKEREDIVHTLLEEYRQELKRLQTQLQGQSAVLDLSLRQLWVNNLAEQTYYRLWRAPWQGYPFYLAWANDWAKSSPLPFRRLQRQIQRLREHVDQENREDTARREQFAVFWEFWALEHRLHEAALAIARYQDFSRAHHILQETREAITDYADGPAKSLLRALHALTGVLYTFHRAFHQGKPEEYKEALQKAEGALEQLSMKYPKGEDTQEQAAVEGASPLLEAIAANYWGMFYRRQGNLYKARQAFERAVTGLRRYQTPGLAGVLINLAYLHVIQSNYRTANDLLIDALRRAGISGDLRTQIRAWSVRALLYSLNAQTAEAQQSVEQVFSLCETEDMPRFRGLALTHWGRTQRAKWNRLIAQERFSTHFQEGIQEYLLSGLRLLLPWHEAQKGIPDSISDLARQIWTSSPPKWMGKFGGETAWDLRHRLQGDETIELLREISRLFRELAWGLHRQYRYEMESKALKGLLDKPNRAAETFAWRAATGQSTPMKWGWWQEEAKSTKVVGWMESQRQKAGGAHFYPLAPMIDLAWHYQYQYRFSLEEDEAFIHWLLDRFPAEYRIPNQDLAYWPPTYHDKEKSQGDPRLWNLLGKLYMLWGQLRLRQVRQAKSKEEKIGHIQQAVQCIAISMEYNRLLGGDSNAMRRAESALYDWLLRHEDEEINGGTLIEAFHKATDDFQRNLQKADPYWQDRGLRLKKFLNERNL